ncbi:MAG: EamA family transporter [Sphingobium sp.]|nr:MAG: EamA family transporter [Sphingobium sp.]
MNSAASGNASGTALPVAFAACCAGVAVFSVMDGAMKGLSLAIGVYNALLWRSVAGTVIGLICMAVTRNPWPAGPALRIHMLRGVVATAMVMFFFFGLTRLPMAEGIALSFIAPLIALYLAALMLGERIGRNVIFASLLGLAGVGVILSARVSGDYDPRALPGALSVLASAVLFAWNLILQKQQAGLASPVEAAFFQHLVILCVLGVAAPVFAIVPDTRHVPLVIAAAALAFLSLTLLTWAYARAEAQYLIPVEYSAFIWAAIMGWLAFGEHLTLTTLLGAALIVTGCLIAARRRPDIAHVEIDVGTGVA